MRLFYFILLFFNLETYALNNCKLDKKLTLADINPDIIHETMRSSKIKSLGDVICCLPKPFRDSIRVVNHSNSGQPGTRVFLGGFKKFNLIMSLSGEVDASTPGANKLEMMTSSKDTTNKALYDGSIDPLTNKFKVEKNPASCLGCHGKLGIKQPEGQEIRAIFDRFPWTRSNNDLNTLKGRSIPVDKYCNNINKYLKVYGEFKRDKIKGLERFRCIDHNKIKKSRIGFPEDKDFRSPNEGRSLRKFKTKKFSMFQYYFAGVAYGCLPSGDKTKYSEISNWIPNNILNNRSGMVPTPKSIEDINIENIFKKRKEKTTKLHSKVSRVNNLLGQMSDEDLKDPRIFDQYDLEKLSNYCSAYPGKAYLSGAKKIFEKHKNWIKRQPVIFQNHVKRNVLKEHVGEFTGLSIKDLLNYVGIEAMGINLQELSTRFDRGDPDSNINIIPLLNDNNIFKKRDFFKSRSSKNSTEKNIWCERVAKHSLKTLNDYYKKEALLEFNSTSSNTKGSN